MFHLSASRELLGFDRIPLTMQKPISLLRIMILGIEKNEELTGMILFCSKSLVTNLNEYFSTRRIKMVLIYRTRSWSGW